MLLHDYSDTLTNFKTLLCEEFVPVIYNYAFMYQNIKMIEQKFYCLKLFSMELFDI